MNNIIDIKTPAEDIASSLQSDYGLANHGLARIRKAYWNLPAAALCEEALSRQEGRLSNMGALLVDTGKHTGRSPNDKFIVKEQTTADKVWWGDYNRPFDQSKFNGLYKRLQAYMQGRDVFVQDCYGGADPEYRLRVRVITERAWHSHFARNMLLRPAGREQYRRFVPEFTVMSVPSFQADPQVDGTASGTFILVDFAQRLCLIGGTGYGGEIKKSVFSILNYLLPLKGVLPMHCSANIGPAGDTALFFGLSGTGKTTLSADPARRLIGDDEHGWSDAGVFNFEDGCYAKVIRLSPKAEPQIYSAVRRFGTILENVPYDPVTRIIDLDDESRTENTRASYPLDFIANAVPEKVGGHPRNIVFLTCDAFGVMPPIAKLTPDQALYQFISGYTSKVAGTEAGLGKEPQMTFSACFGAPFMVQHPAVYADLLKRKVLKHGVNCWLVNTGWVGGPYGVGQRISIRHTRGLLDAVLSGKLLDKEFSQDPVFGFQVPKSCDGVPSNVLSPADSWPDKARYARKYRELADRFSENFKKFEASCPAEMRAAGPRR
jgi:phosphoenolpyruvate carboxykinase (ATP)